MQKKFMFGAILPTTAVTDVVGGLTTAIGPEMVALLGIAVGLGGLGFVIHKVFKLTKLR